MYSCLPLLESRSWTDLCTSPPLLSSFPLSHLALFGLSHFVLDPDPVPLLLRRLTLNAIGLNMTVGVLRERIQEATKTTLPLSKMRLDTAVGKVLNNKSSLASVNLASGDTVSLNIRK